MRTVQLLGELDRLEGRQAAGHTVDDRDTLGLGGVEACRSEREREKSRVVPGMKRRDWAAPGTDGALLRVYVTGLSLSEKRLYRK